MSNTIMPVPAPALVLFGRDEAGKPHAAWFDQASAELAAKAATLMRMRAVPVETEALRELATTLPRGRVFASGRAFTPFIKATLFERLAEATKDLIGLVSHTASDGEVGSSKAAGGEHQQEAAEASVSHQAPTAEKRPTGPEQVGVLATTGPGLVRGRGNRSQRQHADAQVVRLSRRTDLRAPPTRSRHCAALITVAPADLRKDDHDRYGIRHARARTE